MQKSIFQKLMLGLCALVLFTSCAHYGQHDKCACGKGQPCAHHQDGKDNKADEECKDCKK